MPLSLLPGGPTASQICAGTLAGGKGETVTFSRALAAYGTNASGTLVQLSSNQPVVESLGLRIEPAHKNLIRQSQSFNTTWTKRNGTAQVAADNLTAPDGTLTADTISALGAAGVADMYIGGSDTATGTTQPSFYIYPISTTGSLGFQANVGVGASHLDLSKLTPSAWTRVSNAHPAVTVVTPWSATAVAPGMLFSAQSGGPLSFGLWGAQLEVGAVVHSYVPTTTTSATCPVDAATMDVSALPIASGAVSADVAFQNVDPTYFYGFTIIDSRDTATGESGVLFYVYQGALGCGTNRLTGTGLNSSVLSWTAGRVYRLRFRWGAGNMWLYRDGTLVASITDGSAVMPTSHAGPLRLGNNYAATTPLDGYLDNLKFTR